MHFVFKVERADLSKRQHDHHNALTLLWLSNPNMALYFFTCNTGAASVLDCNLFFVVFSQHCHQGYGPQLDLCLDLVKTSALQHYYFFLIWLNHQNDQMAERYLSAMRYYSNLALCLYPNINFIYCCNAGM